MNAPITLRDKWLAIGCYLSGLIYMLTIVPALVIVNWMPNAPHYWLNIANGLLVSTIFVLVIMPMVAWMLTHRCHPFVDLAGKTAFNLAFNFLIACLLEIIFWVFVALTTCGVDIMTGGGSSAFNNIFQHSVIILVLILGATWLSHNIFSLAGIVAASKGIVPRFPLLFFLYNSIDNGMD